MGVLSSLLKLFKRGGMYIYNMSFEDWKMAGVWLVIILTIIAYVIFVCAVLWFCYYDMAWKHW